MRTAFVHVLIVAAASSALADLCADRSFSIAGTNFVFQFEDPGLSISNQHRIADDIVMLRNFGIESEIGTGHVNGYDGYIRDKNLDDTPYFDQDLNFPHYYNIVNLTNALVIPAKLSDAYTNAFAFLDSNTNMSLSVHTFVEAFASNRLDSIPSNQIHTLVYYPGITSQEYETMRDEIVEDLKFQRYCHPSALSFHQTGPGTNGFPHAAIWMRMPVASWSDYSRKNLISIFHAFWYDGMWRLYPSEW